jgi:hypothetical protein
LVYTTGDLRSGVVDSIRVFGPAPHKIAGQARQLLKLGYRVAHRNIVDGCPRDWRGRRASGARPTGAGAPPAAAMSPIRLRPDKASLHIADIAPEHAPGYLGAFGPHLDERIDVIEDQMLKTIESVRIGRILTCAVYLDRRDTAVRPENKST